MSEQSDKCTTPVAIGLPTVARVDSDTGSRVQPPLGRDWTEERKLAWKAALTAADTGLSISLYREPDVPGAYGLGVGGAYFGATTFAHMWSTLNGVAMGAEAVRRG